MTEQRQSGMARLTRCVGHSRSGCALAGLITLSQNPFLNPPALFESPPHVSLSPTLSSLGQLSDVLHRQDRLVKAGEAAKEGFRKTIRTLQARNQELEDRVKALEQQLAKR